MNEEFENGFPQDNPDLPEGVQGEDIKATDIVFDCPHCGHGLVIDNRGAGLVIHCVECGKPVQVPIPEGMDISDLDEGPETLHLQIRTLRNALLKAENRERELQKLVGGLTSRRDALERARSAQLHRLSEIKSACETIRRQLANTSDMIGRIAESLSEEFKQ